MLGGDKELGVVAPAERSREKRRSRFTPLSLASVALGILFGVVAALARRRAAAA